MVRSLKLLPITFAGPAPNILGYENVKRRQIRTTCETDTGVLHHDTPE
jgi:hypothetical protein